MNTPNDSRPRLLCRAVRGWSVLAGDPVTGLAARHVAACPACQKFFAASAALDVRLRTAAPGRAAALPVGFEQRMERALAPLTREPAAAEESGSPWVLWSFLGSVAAAAVVVFVLMRPVAPVPSDGPAIAELGDDPAAILNESVQVAQALNNRFWNSMAPTATTFVRENSLQQEIGAVYSDAQSALQFLALNFLPASAMADLPPAT
jgi:hypothetical protein